MHRLIAPKKHKLNTFLLRSAQRLKANQNLREEHHEHQDRRQNPLRRYQ
jgi:hypothetical protein